MIQGCSGFELWYYLNMGKDKKIIIKVRAIILHQGKLLVLRFPNESRFLALPGGHLEWGEDVKECLDREMVEELGVKPVIGQLAYVSTFTHEDGKHHVEFFFEIKNGVDYLNSEKLARSHSHEVEEIIWASPTDDIVVLPKGLADDFRAGKILSGETKYIKG